MGADSAICIRATCTAWAPLSPHQQRVSHAPCADELEVRHAHGQHRLLVHVDIVVLHVAGPQLHAANVVLGPLDEGGDVCPRDLQRARNSDGVWLMRSYCGLCLSSSTECTTAPTSELQARQTHRIPQKDICTNCIKAL